MRSKLLQRNCVGKDYGQHVGNHDCCSLNQPDTLDRVVLIEKARGHIEFVQTQQGAAGMQRVVKRFYQILQVNSAQVNLYWLVWIDHIIQRLDRNEIVKDILHMDLPTHLSLHYRQKQPWER